MLLLPFCHSPTSVTSPKSAKKKRCGERRFKSVRWPQWPGLARSAIDGVVSCCEGLYSFATSDDCQLFGPTQISNKPSKLVAVQACMLCMQGGHYADMCPMKQRLPDRAPQPKQKSDVDEVGPWRAMFRMLRHQWMAHRRGFDLDSIATEA